MLKADEYDALRGFYQKMAAADQQQLVLTTAAPAGSGN
jgi:type IV pilus biogenesis protein CpaD/CtpE